MFVESSPIFPLADRPGSHHFMNFFEYLYKAAATKLGLLPMSHHMRIASEKTLLLREAEVIIGKVSWQNLEESEDLISEYWRLRQLDKEEKELIAKLEEAKVQEKITFESLENSDNQHVKEFDRLGKLLEQAKTRLTEELQNLQNLLNESEKIRKLYKGMKLKLSVLMSNEGSEEGIANARQRCQEIRRDFDAVVEKVIAQRGEVEKAEKHLEACEAKHRLLDSKIGKSTRDNTRKYSEIRRSIVELESSLILLDVERNDLYHTIGRYLRNPENAEKPGIKATLATIRPLLSRTRKLNYTIDCSHRLAGL